mmetsp:Transcript_104648/g.293274  ORF Transcript_104648/g.293274 Transcript_104648/m.293274 type:complete len:155 (+) Transcript_104648:200-664(+)
MATEMEIESSSTKSGPSVELPENRFALELEFVQALASPAYLHYLATNTTNEGQSLLLCPRFKAFLRYLQATWTRPEYSRFIHYPHSLHFLNLLIKNDAFCRELAQVPYRNFAHQQQYFAWQNRFSTLFGCGEQNSEPATSAEGENITLPGTPSS